MEAKEITDWQGRPWKREDVLANVGRGWSKLVSELIDDLFELGWDGSLHQIKEKFGGLRFYIGGGSDEVWNRIHQAENKSLQTCERCGKPGRPTNAGWIRTVCEAHEAADRVKDFITREEHHEPTPKKRLPIGEGGGLSSGDVSDPDEVVP